MLRKKKKKYILNNTHSPVPSIYRVCYLLHFITFCILIALFVLCNFSLCLINNICIALHCTEAVFFLYFTIT